MRCKKNISIGELIVDLALIINKIKLLLELKFDYIFSSPDPSVTYA